MSPRLTFQPVEVETGSPDREGGLVFDDRRLVAVLVRLGDMHDEYEGWWHAEFGVLPRGAEMFRTLGDALSAIEARLAKFRR